ncbi:DUF4375 domain-containing protein [Blastopirellula marina]|uniref:DNA mimic protein DMP19 C-terminal domain-containing protein n=2 Tax=Blastopirellula marina TaxID=124 RepID=A0A2S8F4D5_9BACT|nr:hypothetical protein C5Y98_28900 [Blastopirellula marina]PTL41001.1 DUF4375 domain-containing protein [Blastopirellula marina]
MLIAVSIFVAAACAQFLAVPMNLPPAVREAYVAHFRQIRADHGASLGAVLKHYGNLNDDLWLLLNRIVDWRQNLDIPPHAADRYVMASVGLRTDVQNGGFSQYFTNEAGNYWQDALAVLIGGDDAAGAAHFRRALAPFPNATPSVDQAERDAELGDIEDADPDWDNRLNAEYCQELCYPSDETLFAALQALEDPDFVPNIDK